MLKKCAKLLIVFTAGFASGVCFLYRALLNFKPARKATAPGYKWTDYRAGGASRN